MTPLERVALVSEKIIAWRGDYASILYRELLEELEAAVADLRKDLNDV